jgi:transposase InsO family protein
MQEAFVVLRSKFAESIHLIHPDESLPFIINTDASCRAIGGVLMQTDNNGETHIVSTASRVLSPAEQRYSVAELELLAIVYSLEKFRIYVYGHQIFLNTDNKALTFINRCVLTSNRIARWVLMLQEYDLQIQHISGASNYIADIISRNPAGLSEQDIKDLSRPREIMVTAIDLNIDKAIGKKLKDLATFQRRDPKLRAIIETTARTADQEGERYMLRQQVLYCKGGKNYPYWRAVLPAELESDVIKFTHESLGHQGTAKCIAQITHTFHVNSLGRKIRKFVSRCDICQRVKHPNRSYMTEWRSHLPTERGMLCATDLFGPLPVGRGGVRYILVILDIFSKFVKLYALRAATTKACLNKIANHYITHVIQPKRLLSDNGSQFASPLWRRKLGEMGIEVMYTPIRRPQSNPSERCMRQIGQFCKIYCSQNHKEWPLLLNDIEKWLNKSVSESTGYTPVELMFEEAAPDLFRSYLKKAADQLPAEETHQQRALMAYARMKERAARRNAKRKRGKTNWEPKIGDLVLLKRQAVSEAVIGKTKKFVQPYVGPVRISKLMPPSAYEVAELSGKLRGVFNKESIKPYLQAE